MKDVIKEFVYGVKAWYDALLPEYRHKPCIICGRIPENDMALAEAIKELEEKAWKYDQLSK